MTERTPLLNNNDSTSNDQSAVSVATVPPTCTTTIQRPPPEFGAPSDAPPPSNSRYGVAAFLGDLGDVQNGTVPISFLIATVIGLLCGVFVWVYYTVLYALLDAVWGAIPERMFAPSVPAHLHWLWVPIVVLGLSLFVGLSVHYLGDPGDLKVTVGRVHETAFVPISWLSPMILASIFSIIGGGSLGPEAALITLCGALSGWISRTLFRQRYKNLVRRHTLCGMSCATAAFFGVPLGGALFALEVNNRLGYEYFEHALYAIYSGTVCLMVFRGIGGLAIGPVWKLTSYARDMPSALVETSKDPPIFMAAISTSNASQMLVGAAVGLCGALIAMAFAHGHGKLVRFLNSFPVLSHYAARSFVGGVAICTLGVLFPQTLFWGEYELEKIAVATDTVRDLPHIWPKGGGLTYFEITGFFSACLVGVAKLIAISFTVACGYRGGFIFPFFTAGAAFGRAAVYAFPGLHPVVAVLCMGAGINTSITRTALSTPMILAALSGEPNAAPPVLAASLMAIFVTYYLPFIKEQRGRDSLAETQLYSYTLNNLWLDKKDQLSGANKTLRFAEDQDEEIIAPGPIVHSVSDVSEQGNTNV